MYDANVVCNVAIIGGGPGGSTCATLLRKYAPDAKVVVLEREVFPRDHVGESQLPAITPILHEMGVWEKCEAAGFPVKTGAMYRWGNSDDLWKLDFLVGQKYVDRPRPAPLDGQRLQTTFHVDRAVYDEILLDHAAECGVEVREGARVIGVRRDGDKVLGLDLANGETVEADWYVDASGHAGILRRAMGVEVHEPTTLKNIAIWDYWTNPAWAETVNKGGVRARIFSLGYGWIWYLPIGETRSSVGFVTHADYYKDQGVTPKELYERALREEPFLTRVMQGATSEGRLSTTKDWSFTADRLTGENWFLVGESAGFADPILAAGMSLTQVGARELAYVLVALLHGDHDPEWLKTWYSELNLRRVRQHIRFADYWYRANGHWTDLKAYTSEIAADAGLTLNPDEAFRWLSTGGFATDSILGPSFGSYDLGPAKAVLSMLTGNPTSWRINQVNDLKMNLVSAKEVEVPVYIDGRIERVGCYQRGPRLLAKAGAFGIVTRAIQRERDAKTVMMLVRNALGLPPNFTGYHPGLAHCLEAIESMLVEGWIKGDRNKKRPMIRVEFQQESIRIGDDETDAQIAAEEGLSVRAAAPK
ncbi:NAD(P)/FAD-dependent oxidoreductase [bacterium]|nr:MAG: NAD(P)/FAD-dependent oxidoreductase [bacterium]